MPNSKNLNSAAAFIDYKPAELHKNKDWRIVYYAKIPAKNELKRFRVRVPKISSVSERNRTAKKMVLDINQKLAAGWSPFYEDKTNQYKSYDEVINLFLSIIKREVEDGLKRPPTLKSYTSKIGIFKNYLKKNHKKVKFIVELDIYIINSYLDYIYMERKVSPQTYNNHLGMLILFFEFCISKGFLKQNPAQGIKKKPKQKKKREVLGQNEKTKLKEYGNDNKAYYTLCMLTYYTFIRRTELTKIKVSEVNLRNGYITVLAENAKNKKTENVTIPNALYPLLIDHLTTANNSDYLFSANNFKPGKKQLKPKKISDEWVKFRKKHKIETKYQFYSLKDTGITDLLNTGIPAIKVRDQARHHDLEMTETYTCRNEKKDEVVQTANFRF